MPLALMLAIPNYGDRVSGQFLDCLTRLTAHLARRFPAGALHYMRIGLQYIDIARNLAWEHARQSQAEHLLFIDDDMTFTPETFETLWETPGDVVSALYFIRRTPPTAPCMYFRTGDRTYAPIIGYRQNAVVEVDAVGLGFVLIRRRVIDGLDRPFSRDGGKGEDIFFCERAKAAGFSVTVNTAAKAGHLLTQPLIIDESNAGGANAGFYGAPQERTEPG
jgi:hypothetical protein